MRKLLLILLLITWVLNTSAQEFGVHWIAYPLPNDTSEVLFRQTYLSDAKPRQAVITVASTGTIRLYVNGRNVARDIFLSNPDTATVSFRTFDVTRFLRTDSNTVAVWYAPSRSSHPSKQLSLEYYGRDWQGKRFYSLAGKGWQCKKLSGSSVSQGKETFDARHYTPAWTYSPHHSWGWVEPTGTYESGKMKASRLQAANDSVFTLISILKPIEVKEDSLGVVCDFGRPFNGIVRLTLRNAPSGETVHVGNYTYICKGQLDEQAFARFSCEKQRKVRIHGDSRFRRSQIQKIEGLEIGKKPKGSYLY